MFLRSCMYIILLEYFAIKLLEKGTRYQIDIRGNSSKFHFQVSEQ